MNTKIKRNSLLFVAGLFVLCSLCLIFASFGVKSTAYADSANPYLQVTCNEASKSGEGWNWQQEAGNGTLTLNNYNGQEISIGGVSNGKVDVVLVGNNKITVTAPYGNRAFNTYNVSTLTFKGSGSLAIDFQRTATEQAYMYGIYMGGDASSNNNGNLMFDESCTVTVKVYGTVAEKNGSVNAIYIPGDRTSSGNVTVGENATLNIDLKCDKLYQTYGIYTRGNIALNGTVDIKMEYTGTGSTYDTWRDVYTSSSYTACSIGTDAKITSVCPGSSGSSLIAFSLVANGGANISNKWTYIASDEQYFENDDCLVHVWDHCPDNISFKNYSYGKLAAPLTLEDKAEYDVPATVYGGDVAYSSIALLASGGSGEYTYSIVSAADGNTSGVGISSNESDLNKIYVAPNIRRVSKATEITVKVTDKGGYSKTITVNIGAVAAPAYSATVDPVDFGTVRVGYGTQDAVSVTVKNTGTGKIWTNGASVELEGKNASDYFTLGLNSVPTLVNAGSTMTNWWIKPNSGLAVGSYTATIKFSGTPEYSQYGGSSVEATATVTFVVTEHDFDTSTWEHDETKHWNPCKDDGCTVHGNEAAHDKNGEVTGAVAATFDSDGQTGDKHCSVCGAKSEDSKVIPAGKYIRVSQATMEPAAITDQLTANDLVFTSLDTSKYTVALWRVFDLTNEALNTDGGQYPKDSKFVAEHEYAIEIEFTAVGFYVYNEMSDKYWSTFTLNGNATGLSAAVSVGGARQRRVTFTAADTTIPVTVTDVQISFSELNVERGGSYTFTATVNGTGAFDNSVIWSVEGAVSSTIVGGILSVTANESSSTITVKATSKQDSTKYATKTVTVRSLITVSQKGVETQYKVVAGEKINLTAETAASGYHFKEWQVLGAGTFADKTAQKTEFTVPHENVTVTSVYELHTASGAEWLTDSTKHYHVCSCGTEIDAAPHTPDRAEATETEPIKCSVCGYVITPALGHTTHTPEENWRNDETNHWHKCTGCSEILDKATHTYGDWTVTKQPTATESGEKERTCSVCGYKQIETVPMTGESEKVAITVTGGNGGGSYNVGDTVTVTANAPAEGKKFDGWYVKGEKVSSDNSYTFTATEGITLEARYVNVSGGDPTTPTDPEPDNKGLSGGAIAGITIACVFVAGIGGFAIFWFVIKKKSFADLLAIFKKK